MWKNRHVRTMYVLMVIVLVCCILTAIKRLNKPSLLAAITVEREQSKCYLLVKQHQSAPAEGKKYDIPVERVVSGYIKDLETVRYLEWDPFSHLMSYTLKRSFHQENCSQWAVVTTINPPTQAIKQIEGLEDWCLVVVGDQDTPDNFTLAGQRSVYLGVSEQEHLTYRTVQLTPWRTFSRKNIGYLYAIQHGAEVIFDFDDDNKLNSDKLNIQDILHRNLNVARVRGNLWNPYPFYGFKDAWPRGFPLDLIKKTYTTAPPVKNVAGYGVKRVGAWQLLSDGDTDVDAIYRLTRGIPNITFSRKFKGTRLPPGVMSPFNAQSTLFHRDAFWSMSLPLSVHARVSDIWRAYMAERLMWEARLGVAFLPSFINATGRNFHKPYFDYQAELPLYQKAGILTKYLTKWKCQRNLLKECILQLYIDMFEVGILEEEDVSYMVAWLNDLSAMGYVFPAMQNNQRWRMEDWRKIRLCVQFNTNFPLLEENINSTLKLLHSHYAQYFDRISYTGSIPRPDYISEEIQYIQCNENQTGYFQQKCIVAHLESFPSEDGYLYIADDAFIDFSRLSKMPFDKIWIQEGQRYNITNAKEFKGWYWWNSEYGYNSLIDHWEKLPQSMKDKVAEATGSADIIRSNALADFVYIPQVSRKKFIEATKALAYEDPPLFCEIALPIIADIADGPNVIPLEECLLWEERRTTSNLRDSAVSGKCDVVHPFKLTNTKERLLWMEQMRALEEEWIS